MSTATTTVLNTTYTNVTGVSIGPLDVGTYDELIFSCSCTENTEGVWKLSRLDAFNTPYLFQEGNLFQGDQSLGFGPSASFDLSNQFGDSIQIDIQGANGTTAVTVCLVGKAYE